MVFELTNGYKDQTKFLRSKNGMNMFNSYKNYLIKGIFRPDLMPNSPAKTDWFRFFENLSAEFSSHFKSINAGLYLSQTYFEHRQSNIIYIYTTQIR